MQDVTVPTFEALLEASAATDEFKTAAIDVHRNGRSSEYVKFSAGNPPVKVIRTLSWLLETYPDLAIHQIEVRGQSGCSDYRGDLIVNGGEKKIRFVWDCAWKAREMGWKDFFGDPDQIRAARTFGYRCFEKFEEI